MKLSVKMAGETISDKVSEEIMQKYINVLERAK